MAETMPNEMDQRASSSESSVVEIASETPQQQEFGELIGAVAMPVDIGPSEPHRPVPIHRGREYQVPASLHVPCCEGRPIGNLVGQPNHHNIGVVGVDIRDGDERKGICISRVVHTMRDIKPDVYTPKFVSIGPFHHGNERLQDMERSKQVLFKRFTQRRHGIENVLISSIQSSVLEVRASYSENINLGDKELVELILVDAAFIIELFLTLHRNGGKEIFADDSTLLQLAILGTLPLDLILFENQLPFSVLKRIFDIALPNDLDDNVLTFPKLACEFFSKAFDLKMPEHDHDSYVSGKHFTDLVRFLLLQRTPPPKMEPCLWNTPKLLYSAKELQELGVKFEVNKSKSILDIMFSGRVLELTQILVADPVTDALYNNMVAFE